MAHRTPQRPLPRQLPAEEVENWLNDEIDAGIAPSSVLRHYRTLRRMLQVAVDKQKLLTNPCNRVEAPPVPATEMMFLDWDEVIERAEAHNPRFRTFILFAVETGMRWSELVGLRRRNLDLRTGGSGSPPSSETLSELRGTEDLHLSIEAKPTVEREQAALKSPIRSTWRIHSRQSRKCAQRCVYDREDPDAAAASVELSEDEAQSAGPTRSTSPRLVTDMPTNLRRSRRRRRQTPTHSW